MAGNIITSLWKLKPRFPLVMWIYSCVSTTKKELLKFVSLYLNNLN